MESHQAIVYQERAELSERISKLAKELANPPAGVHVSGPQHKLMVEQLGHMRAYLKTLDARVALFDET